MIINLPWSLELDFNQQVGAQLSWEAARVRCPVLLYTLFVPLYSLWQRSDQDCCCSKKVLRTADMQVAIRGVISSWGSTKQAVVDAGRVETEQFCDYGLSLWHYYFTYYIHYRHYYKIRICDSAWHSLKNEVKGIHHHTGLVLVANRSTIDSVWEHQGALPVHHGRASSRGGVVRDGCRKASLRAWQDETDRPSHQQFWQ
jgi:hypothetical protein